MTDFSNGHFENKILSTYVRKCLKSRYILHKWGNDIIDLVKIFITL